LKPRLAASVAATVVLAQLGNVYGWIHTIASVLLVLALVTLLRIAIYGPKIFRWNGASTSRGARRVAELLIAGAASIGDINGGRDCALEASSALDREDEQLSWRHLLGLGISLAIRIPLQSRRRATCVRANPTPTLDARADEQVQRVMALWHQPIEDLDFMVRTYNCLKREGVLTVGQLTQLTEEELLKIRNFGQRSVDDVNEKLDQLGLSLPRSRNGDLN
jgi:hypothetical protein